jgi:ribonuclease-3
MVSYSFPIGSHATDTLLGGGRRPNIAKKDLPPLPDIRDDNLRLQVFTHRSFYARQTHQFEDPPGKGERSVNSLTQPLVLSDNARFVCLLDDPCPDNEMYVPLDPDGFVVHSSSAPGLTSDRRLEYLGDSVLGLVVAELLLTTFPNLRVGSNTVSTRPRRPCPPYSRYS